MKLHEPESSVIRACRQWLRLRGIFHVRHHPSRPVGSQGAIRFVRVDVMDKGAPDLFCFPSSPRLFVGIECKATGKKQTDDQVKWQIQCEAAGHLYLLVDSLEALEKRWPMLLR